MNLGFLRDPTLIVSAVFYGALLALAAAATLFGVWLAFVLLLSLWRYGYSVLRLTAQGRHTIPAPDIATLNPVGDWRLVMHFVAFPLLVILFLYVEPFGDGFGNVLNAAGALAVMAVFPASASMLALTGSLEAAFNPANLAEVVRTLGRNYFVLAGVCISVAISAELFSSYALPDLPLISNALGNAVAVWALLEAFALTGSLLRTHRADFDIPGAIETEEERRERLRRDDWRKTLDLAYASIRSGLLAEGYETLRRLMAQENDSQDVQYWLLDNMIRWDDPRHALAIASALIDRHVAESDLDAALELYMRCRRADPAFAASLPAAAAMAAFARDLGRHGIADELAAPGGPLGPRRL